MSQPITNSILESYGELRELHGLIDQGEKWLGGHLGVPLCVENCGRCCMDNTPTVHSIEASYIISYLMGAGKLNIIDWCRGWLLEKHSIAVTYEGMPRGVVKQNVLLEWNALQHSQCILLTQEKQCLIHKFRPLPCRAYGVLKMPELYCPRPFGKDESAGNRAYVGGEPALILMKETREFRKRLKERNPDWAQMGFLPTMIFRQARELEFRGMIADNKIASAKLIGTDFNTQELFQDRIEESPVNLLKA